MLTSSATGWSNIRWKQKQQPLITQALGETYKWLLYGDDDTLVRTYDHCSKLHLHDIERNG